MKRLAYLDHNVLDLMTKGDPLGVKKWLEYGKLTPVFSSETLKEIYRSKGYESKFLELLETIEAEYLNPILNNQFKQTGQASIKQIPARTAYESFLKNKSESFKGNIGFDLLQKFHGGNQDRSFAAIFQDGANELQQYLLGVLNNLENDPEIEGLDLEELRKTVASLPEIMTAQTASAAAELDNRGISPIHSLEETGIAPKQLKNIQPPNVVLKVWGTVSEKMETGSSDLDSFFGLKPQKNQNDPERELTLQEKVNAIYHQLNFLGYYRDSNMKKERRFKASFSDMTHAGIASFCHVFLCRDRDLIKKTSAAFEYLDVKTEIVNCQIDKPLI